MKRIILIILLLSIIINLSFLLSLKFGFWDPFFNDSASYMRGLGRDFFVFYSSGKFMLEGKSIYSFPVHPSVPDAYGPYIYLPHLILLIGVPMTIFPPVVAYGIWVAISEGLLLGCAYITYLIAQKLHHPYPWLGAAAWLFFTPVYPDLFVGQLGILMASLLMLMLWGHLQGKPFLSYGAWTLSFFTKIITLPLAFAFLRQRKIRWVLITLGLAFLPLIIYLNFYHPGHLMIQYKIRTRGLAPGFAGAPNFMVLLNLWNLPFDVIFFLKVFIVGWGLLLTLAKETDSIDNWALWMATFFMVYGYVWEHHYLLLLPFLVFYLMRRTDPWLWGVYFLLAIPTPYIFYKTEEIHHSIYYLSKVVPVVVFYIYLVARHLRAPTRWLYFDQTIKGMRERVKN